MEDMQDLQRKAKVGKSQKGDGETRHTEEQAKLVSGLRETNSEINSVNEFINTIRRKTKFLTWNQVKCSANEYLTM